MIRRLFFAGCLLMLGSSVSAQFPFAHQGIDSQHPSSSVLPNEQVESASGALAVVATDLVLPGNAGLDLVVTRVYNSAVYPDYNNGGSTTLEEDSVGRDRLETSFWPGVEPKCDGRRRDEDRDG